MQSAPTMEGAAGPARMEGVEVPVPPDTENLDEGKEDSGSP